jgi:hypothetical protein
MKSLYVLQPYKVGSKNSKSLAIIIPAEVKKECNIDISTPFALYPDKKTKRVTLQNINATIQITNMMKPAAESFEASKQQVSSGAQ